MWTSAGEHARRQAKLFAGNRQASRPQGRQDPRRAVARSRLARARCAPRRPPAVRGELALAASRRPVGDCEPDPEQRRTRGAEPELRQHLPLGPGARRRRAGTGAQQRDARAAALVRRSARGVRGEHQGALGVPRPRRPGIHAAHLHAPDAELGGEGPARQSTVPSARSLADRRCARSCDPLRSERRQRTRATRFRTRRADRAPTSCRRPGRTGPGRGGRTRERSRERPWGSRRSTGPVC